MMKNADVSIKNDLEPSNFPNDSQSSWFKRVFFDWVRPLLSYGLKNPLSEKQFFQLNKEDEPAYCSKKFNQTLARYTPDSAPIYSALLADNKTLFIVSLLFGGLYCICNLWLIGLLKSFIHFIENTNPSVATGAFYAISFCLIGTLCWVLIQHCFLSITKLSLRIRGALVLTIYERIFKLKASERLNISVGEMSNLMLQDAPRIAMASQALVMLIVSIFLVLAACMLLYLEIGLAGIVGTIAAFIVIPLSNVLNKRISTNAKSLMQVSDIRISRMGELLSRIKAVKAMNWGECFKDLIDQSRMTEIKLLKDLSWSTALLNLVIQSSPLFIAVITFATYVALGNPLELPIVLSAVAIFGLLKTPVMHLPRLIIQVTEAKVSIERIERIFKLQTATVKQLDIVALPGTINFINADIKWTENAEPVLKEIMVSIEPGTLVGLLGASGSGKSTLLNALIEESIVSTGSYGKSGNISFATQKPFIISGTVRENILFGSEYNEERYLRVIQCCHLIPDLNEFPYRDHTVLTENGGNLSGGQKQRIALARAIYHEADIYILDDVLSALDEEVGSHIFNDVILNFLNKKTRIITSHRYDLIERCDRILKVENGFVTEATIDVAVKSSHQRNHEPIHQLIMPIDSIANTNVDKSAMAEERSTGRVNKSIYMDYFKKSGGIYIFCLVLLVFGVRELLAVGSDLWLSYGTAASVFDSKLIIIVFSFLCVLVASATLLRAALLLRVSIRVSEKVHNEMLDSILRTPIQFFETNPIGRVLNRFSKDLRTVDQEIGPRLLDVISVTFVLLSAFVVIESANPFAFGVIALIAYLYYKIQVYYRATAPEINRLEAISQSPVFTHIHETIDGLLPIKNFGMEKKFYSQVVQKVRTSLQANFTQQVIAEWLSVNLDMMGVILLGLVAFIATIARAHVSWSLASLSVTYVMMVTINFQRAVHSITDLEISMTSLERTHSFSNLVAEIQNAHVQSIQNWPLIGSISFDNVTLVYHDNPIPVLKGVSFDILPGEKIGVVGRTGSGKSSLVNALFKLVDIEQGTICIDGVDISKINLTILRNSIAFLPQDPLLITGSLRFNLDPYGQYTNQALIDSLTLVGLNAMELTYPLHTNGSNLSQGHRQLVSLARILLFKPKILILDEVTANVDVETDRLVQAVIRKNFSTTTIITISHRLETIIQSDRILNLEGGRVIDFASPEHLLSKEGSRLYGFEKSKQGGS